MDVYALETKIINGVLFVSFKDQNEENVNGIAKFIKGFNQRYRIVQTIVESSEYSSVVQFYRVEIKGEQYTAVSGYNLSDEIKYYGLDFYTYLNSGYFSKDRIIESMKFEIENQQFLEFYQTKELENILVESFDETRYNNQLVATSMYNLEGEEFTDNYRIMEESNENKSFVVGKAELFLVYMYIAIILALGAMIIRYSLAE